MNGEDLTSYAAVGWQKDANGWVKGWTGLNMFGLGDIHPEMYEIGDDPKGLSFQRLQEESNIPQQTIISFVKFDSLETIFQFPSAKMCIQPYLLVTCKETKEEDPTKMRHACLLAFKQCEEAEKQKKVSWVPCDYGKVKFVQANLKPDSEHPNPNGLRADCPVCTKSPAYQNLASEDQLPAANFVMFRATMKSTGLGEAIDQEKFQSVWDQQRPIEKKASEGGRGVILSTVMGWITYFDYLKEEIHYVSMKYDVSYEVVELLSKAKHLFKLTLNGNKRVKPAE
ncbi:hypothetical protein MMC18_002476 [Xylographa bjoerkii]|nr:hypothetical protein [Xylographa bjoerkii]